MRRRWHKRPRTRRDLDRLVRKAGMWFAWLSLSVVLQVGTLTLIWELTFGLLPPVDASRTGFFQGMQAPRKPVIPPPEIPVRHEPELLPPEEPPIIEVDPLEAEEGSPERPEKLIEYVVTDWEPADAPANLDVLLPHHTVAATGTSTGRHERSILRAGGGSGLTENAVELGLRWLADHQDTRDLSKQDRADGKWDCDDFMKHDPLDDKCDGAGGARYDWSGAHYDVGVTGLALLAFLGAGYADRGSSAANRYARNVRMGLRYLMTSQAEDGVFGTRATSSFMFNHAIATQAICEAYWMTGNPRYRKPAQEALDFIAYARNPYVAWRYEPRGGENDTAVTTWAVLALQAGRRAGLAVDPDAFEGARQWINKITDPTFAQVGYNYPGGAPRRPDGMQDRFPPEKSHSMTAAGVLCRIVLGEDPRSAELIQKGANLCVELPPVWNPDSGSIDMYYWYFGTQALYQVGGAHWRKWNESMYEAIVRNQHQQGSGSRAGSWDPIGVWGDFGGRVYSTAMMTMCLEVYYRYERVFGAK